MHHGHLTIFPQKQSNSDTNNLFCNTGCVDTHVCIYVCMYVCMYVWLAKAMPTRGHKRPNASSPTGGFKVACTNHAEDFACIPFKGRVLAMPSAKGFTRSHAILRLKGLSRSHAILRLKGFSRSHGTLRLKGFNRSQAILRLKGFNRSHGTLSLKGFNRSQANSEAQSLLSTLLVLFYINTSS